MNSSDDFLKMASALFLGEIAERRLGRTGSLTSSPEIRKKIDLTLGESHGAEEILSDLKKYLQLSTNTLSPKFMNQLFSGLRTEAIAGDWASSLSNATMATYEVAPVATLMEHELIRKMLALIGWKTGEGIMVTGGSNANLVGLLVARNTLFPESKKSGNEDRKLCLFVSEESHYSFEKAANLMGLGTNRVLKVKADEKGKMIPAELRQEILRARAAGLTPFFVGATAGTTVLGAYDPVDEISMITKENNLWLHVDGAWGGSVLLSEKHRSLLKGLASADSFAWDTHKMLGTGLISSFFLTARKDVLKESNHSGGQDYIFHDSDDSALDTGPSSLQCGRRNDALKVWLTWKAQGDAGLGNLVDTLFEKSSLATKLVSSMPELELLHQPEMLNVCFRFKAGDNKTQKLIRQEILKEGEFFVNVASRRGQTFFRLITAHPELTEAHLRTLFKRIIEIGNRHMEKR